MKILDGSPPSTAIRTPDQRLRVFVSSTLKELAAERAAARTAIEQLRLAPGVLELGGGGAAPPPATGGVPGLPGAVRHFHRNLLAALRLGRARHDYLRPRRRAASGRGHAAAAGRPGARTRPRA